jgi:PAS domain S-box-containing protein
MGVILIAFERETEQSSLEQLLSGKGHRVVKAANGLTALDLARRDPPDLIVSDIVLPRMDGFALCRKWKQDERLQSVPFVFYTRRHDDPKYERFALELGAERFLSRSVEPAALTRAVSELLADAPARANPTTPLPTLDDGALQRAAAAEKAAEKAAAQRAAAERVAAEKVVAERAAADKERARREADLQAQIDSARSELEGLQTEHSRLRAQLDESHAAQRRLAEGEARFRRVFEANPLPMWIADHATGGFIAVNEAALALFGYTRAEFLAQKAATLLAPEQQEEGFVRMHVRKDGTPLALSVFSQEIEFDGRSADLVSGFDVTEREAQARRLEKEAEGGRAVLEAAADGCWVLDEHGRIKDVNEAYGRMSGYSREQLLGKTPQDIEDQSSGETTLRLQLGRMGGGERYEVKHRRPDGSVFDVEASVGLLANGGSVMLIRDVSQRRRERAAQRATQRQGEFLLRLASDSERLDESAIVRRVLDQANDAFGSPLSFLYFVDASRKTIGLAAWRERDEPQAVMADAEPLPLARAALFADCVRTKAPVLSNEASVKQTGDGLPDLQRYLAAPMVHHDETIAVLGVANRPAGYSGEDLQLLAALAQGVQHVLSEKRAHAQTLSALHRADVALQGMIDSFVRMSERHDPYTSGSTRRLAALAVALGREAGLDGERQHALRIAALLHDVGNIAVPASLLAKPAPLTETELALMRTHVEEGCQLLAEIDFGAPIADIVYQSHERFDGSGYPRGLKGEDILLEARILGIADTVEAMCSPRPYRPAASLDAALDEINRGAGRLYDPHVAAACTRLFRQHGFMLPE